MNRNRLNLILLAAVLVLGVVAFLQPGLEEEKPAKPALTTLDPERIQRIEIQRPRQDSIVLRRQGDQWQLRLDERWLPANAWRIRQLLELARSPSETRFPAPAELAQYGLAEPRISLRLDTVTLLFGDSEPLTHRRYVRLDDTIHLIDDRHYIHLVAADTDYLRPAPLPAQTRIEALELPDGQRLQRDEDGNWQLQPPRDISQDRINRLLDQWRQAQAMQVSRHSPGKDRIRLQLDDGRWLGFDQTEAEGEWLLIRNDLGLAYHFPPDTRQRLTRLDDDDA